MNHINHVIYLFNPISLYTLCQVSLLLCGNKYDVERNKRVTRKSILEAVVDFHTMSEVDSSDLAALTDVPVLCHVSFVRS